MPGLSDRFTVEFQTRVLAVAVREPYFLDLYSDAFRPALFSTVYHRDFCTWVLEFYAKYKSAPSLSSAKKLLAERIESTNPLKPGYEALIAQIYTMVNLDHGFIRDQIITAAKFQSVRGALFQLTDLLDQGEFDEMPKVLTDALKVGSGVGDIGTELFSAVETAITKRDTLDVRVRTGFKELERATGGFYAGEETVIVSPTGGGKTALLGNLALGIAHHDQVVMYYTLEIGVDRILCRFYARLARVPTKELSSRLSQVYGAIKRFRLSSTGTVYVKYFSPRAASVETLRNHLSFVVANDIRPTAVVVDYADLLRPLGNKNAPGWELLRETYEDLRALGNDFNTHVFTASQSTRETLHKKVIDLNHISESWGKAATADSIPCLCQTADEEIAGVARILVAKARNETRGATIYLRTDFQTLTIKEISLEAYNKKLLAAGLSTGEVSNKRRRNYEKYGV